MSAQQLIILGASARAACFSARRSAYSPYWIDQYGDHDLTENFSGRRVPIDDYPQAILDCIADSPSVAFLYTGALENHLQVLEALEKARPLQGNPAEVCRAVRDPKLVTDCFEQAGITHPKLSPLPLSASSPVNQWLIKPLRGAGGFGVMHYNGNESVQIENHYLQQHISGESRAGVFIGDGRSACLIGVTRQLVGEAFLHAGEFSYCGSIGPLALNEAEYGQWLKIGNVLTEKFGLKGLFGVDAICNNGDIYPVEINPRYTASVEVLELALQLPVIDMHCKACQGELMAPVSGRAKSIIGKAYLFAGRELLSPDDVNQLYAGTDAFPISADIPHAGTVIGQGQPVMTILTRASSQQEVLSALKNSAKLRYENFNVV